MADHSSPLRKRWPSPYGGFEKARKLNSDNFLSDSFPENEINISSAWNFTAQRLPAMPDSLRTEK